MFFENDNMSEISGIFSSRSINTTIDDHDNKN